MAWLQGDGVVEKRECKERNREARVLYTGAQPNKGTMINRVVDFWMSTGVTNLVAGPGNSHGHRETGGFGGFDRVTTLSRWAIPGWL
jgi:hypothetical protein